MPRGKLGADPDVVKRLLEQKQLREYSNRGRAVALAEAEANPRAIEDPKEYVVLKQLRFSSGGCNLKYDPGTTIRDPFVVAKIKQLGLENNIRAIA